jgi:predicted component of type VI protein secretion system
VSRTLIVEDGVTRREVLLVERLSIGRDPKCDITHGDPRLSRRHAELRMTGTGIVVADLQSRNGVRVNGERVDEAVLKPGDVVEAGPLRLRLDLDVDPPAQPVETVATVPILEDDRTRVALRAARPPIGGALAVSPELADDRTRIVPAHVQAQTSAPVPVPAAPPTAVATVTPLDDLPLEDVDRTRAFAAAEGRPAHAPAQPAPAGSRAVLQGAAIGLIAAGVSMGPLLAWEAGGHQIGDPETWLLVLLLLSASAIVGSAGAASVARAARDGRLR